MSGGRSQSQSVVLWYNHREDSDQEKTREDKSPISTLQFSDLLFQCSKGSGCVSDSLSYPWEPFPPTGFPCPALMWGFVPSLVTCWAEFCSYLWGGLFFFEGKGIWERRMLGLSTWRNRGRKNCGWKLLYKRRINKVKGVKIKTS